MGHSEGWAGYGAKNSVTVFDGGGSYMTALYVVQLQQAEAMLSTS